MIQLVPVKGATTVCALSIRLTSNTEVLVHLTPKEVQELLLSLPRFLSRGD